MSAEENRAVALLREQMKDALRWLDGIAADLTPEDAHWKPPGKALPAGAVYAHVLIALDAVVNRMIKGGAPLFTAEWAGKIGVSEPPPGPDPQHPGMPDWTAWSRRVTIDLASLRNYAGAVQRSIDDYLATLSDADLGRTIELPAFGRGRVTVGFMLNNAVLGHAFSHGGEIACLKGLRGKRGSP
jgi:DinB superfamily